MKFYFEDLRKLDLGGEITPQDVFLFGQGGGHKGKTFCAFNRPDLQRFVNRSYLIYTLDEYANYRKDKDIGGFTTSYFWILLMSIVCHELAHAFQTITVTATGHSDTGHGPVFQSHYRSLRGKYVNPYLKREKQILEPNMGQQRAA